MAKQTSNGQPAVYNASGVTLNDQDGSAFNVDANGNVKLTMATTLAGEDITNDVLKVEQRFSYLNITAGQATTVVKGSPGFLHAIIFNSAAAATNVTTVYDNIAASGTKIGTITPVSTNANVPNSVIYDCVFATGLTILTATANSSDMTVIFR